MALSPTEQYLAALGLTQGPSWSSMDDSQRVAHSLWFGTDWANGITPEMYGSHYMGSSDGITQAEWDAGQSMFNDISNYSTPAPAPAPAPTGYEGLGFGYSSPSGSLAPTPAPAPVPTPDPTSDPMSALAQLDAAIAAQPEVQLDPKGQSTPFADAYIKARESARSIGPVSSLFAEELAGTRGNA